MKNIEVINNNCLKYHQKKESLIIINFEDYVGFKEVHIYGKTIEGLFRKNFFHLKSVTVLHIAVKYSAFIEYNVFKGFYNLKDLYLKIGIKKLPDKLLRSLKSLTKLKLVTKNLRYLDNSVFKYNTELVYLEIHYNGYVIMDQVFSPLTKLEFFKFRCHNGYYNKSPNFFNMINLRHNPQLKSFTMFQMNISPLTQYFWFSLSNLVTLILKESYLYDGDEKNKCFLNELPNLKHFFAYECVLRNFSRNSFINNQKLEKIILDLNIYQNSDLSRFPRVNSIRELTIVRNDEEEINSKVFRNLRQLEKLNLFHNKIQKIKDDTFRHTSNLEILDLSHNKINTLFSNSINCLLELKVLKLNNNNITSLPSSLFKGLEELTLIDLSCNAIESLNSATFEGSEYNLDTFHLCDNRIRHLDVRFFALLKNLTILNLDKNKIRLLNSNVFQSLTKLKKLILSNNEIASLPSKLFAKLEDLMELNLRNNKIETQLTFELFSNLLYLKFLDLGSNSIEEISEGCFRNNRCLRDVFLDKNKLKTLPDDIFLVTSIAHMNLSFNPFESFSDFIFYPMARIERCYVSKNFLKICDGIRNLYSRYEKRENFTDIFINVENL